MRLADVEIGRKYMFTGGRHDHNYSFLVERVDSDVLYGEIEFELGRPRRWLVACWCDNAELLEPME